LQDFFLPRILGIPFDHPGGLTQALAGYIGHPMARCGLEMALWDLTGRLEGLPLSRLLGGDKDRVEVGVSIGIQPDALTLVKRIQSYLELGYGRVKIKIKPERDLHDVRVVRRNYPELRLAVDANAAYGLEAVNIFQSLDELDLLMIEQPLDGDDLLDHKSLQSLLSTPICLDESLISLRRTEQAIEVGACRIVNIKPGRVGGLSEAVVIHDFCHSKGVPVWCGGMLETGIGRAANLALATLPGFELPGDISASDRYYAQDIAEPRFQLNPDSTITVPTFPGLGVEVDLDILARFTLRELEIK
jgi:O-succinylbenzoate synthase